MGQTLSGVSILNVGNKKLNNQQNDSNLQLHPQELRFPFECNKRISCSLPLSNNSDYNLAFKVKPTNHKKYCVRPNIGVVLRRSTCNIIFTMEAQEEAPPDMQCKDQILIQSIVLSKNNGATIKDVTPKMFNKKSGYTVGEYKLKVVYVAPPQTPSSVREGSGKDSKASGERVEQQNTSFQIHPQELQFPFELGKQISCPLQLSNMSDNYVVFKVKTSNPKKYYVKPNYGVVLPSSTLDIIVTMLSQMEAPPDMQCKDKFLIQSIVAGHKMFNKESGYEVQQCKLKVAYVAPVNGTVVQIDVGLAQSSVDESVTCPNDVVGKVLGAAATDTFRSNGVRPSYLSNSLTDASTSSSIFWQEKYTNLEAAFKAYITMKEGRIPDQVADILGSSNVS